MTSPIIGICANARNAMPDRSELEALGVGAVRSICYNDDEFEQALDQVPEGVQVVAVLNSEHDGVGQDYDAANDYAAWRDVVGTFFQRFDGRVIATEIGNELDLLGETPELAARLVRDAYWARGDANIKILLSSVAGPDWVAWLDRATALCMGYVDGVCLHPYGKTPDGFAADGLPFGSIAEAVATAHATSGGYPVWLTESGAKIGDVGGLSQQAAYVRAWIKTMQSFAPAVMPFAGYFAWRDDVGGPSERGNDAFGLRNVNGIARPAHLAFSLAMQPTKEIPVVPISVWSGDPPPSARFVLGFADWAAREPTLIGQPHDVAEFGAAPGISQQRTTRGLLTWADLREGQAMMFLDATNGKRYVFDGRQSHEVFG